MPKKPAPWMPEKRRGLVEIYLGCLIAQGKNKTEATENAIEIAKKALGLNYAPIFTELRGAKAIIYQTPNGYATTFMVEPKDDRQVIDFRDKGGINYAKDEASLDSIIGDTLLHLAEQTWDGKDWKESAPFDAKKYPNQASEYASNLIYQARYREAITEGFTQNEAHHIAGNFIMNMGFDSERLEKANKIISDIA